MNKDKVKIEENGIYLRGVAVSSEARVVRKKDGTGSLVVSRVEIATQPGVTVWEEWHDPAQRTDIRIKDDQVIEFPKPKDFEPITLHVMQLKMRNDVVIVSKAERIA